MVNEKIQIRKRKNGRLFKDLEQIQTEVLLAATCDERDQKRRLERMEELKKCINTAWRVFAGRFFKMRLKPEGCERRNLFNSSYFVL